MTNGEAVGGIVRSQLRRIVRYGAAASAVLIGAAVVAGPAPAYADATVTLFAADAVPAVTATSDPNGVELGVRFKSAVGGSITGIRFYQGSGNTGTHTGSLWTVAGTLLAQLTFPA